jgi:hypothetical protein
MRVVITLLEGIENKRIHIGHRDAGDDTLIFIRYNGPQPAYSANRNESTASSKESESASDPWRFIRRIIESQGGTFSLQADQSQETEITFTLPKSEQ